MKLKRDRNGLKSQRTEQERHKHASLGKLKGYRDTCKAREGEGGGGDGVLWCINP